MSLRLETQKDPPEDAQALANILKENDEAKIHWQAVRELEPFMSKLTEQLKPNILAGEYGLLVGDDASGRIPTLILRKIINKVYQEKGRRPIPTIFLQPDKKALWGNNLTQALEEEAKLVRADRNKKSLIVTEYISSGKHVQMMGKALERNGFKYDIATASAFKDYKFGLCHEGAVFCGEIMGKPPSIYGAVRAVGLYEYSVPGESGILYRREKFDKARPLRGGVHSLSVRIAREDVKKVSALVFNNIFISQVSDFSN